MTARSRILAGSANSPPSNTTSSTPSSPIQSLDSDFVVILAALVCALICVLGLLAFARCSWIRRLSSATASLPSSSNKGLKKKVLNSFPKFTYGGDNDERAAKLSDYCAICLTEFAAGEEIRVLPQCGHVFHVGCIDMWLASHSSCPSCRQILVAVAARCQKCGVGIPAAKKCTIQPEARENYVNTFLP